MWRFSVTLFPPRRGTARFPKARTAMSYPWWGIALYLSQILLSCALILYVVRLFYRALRYG
jgi:hypothetical protein